MWRKNHKILLKIRQFCAKIPHQGVVLIQQLDTICPFCYTKSMEKRTRKRRQDTKHALYMIVNVLTNEHYVGITVCGSQVNRALKIRWQKHVRRAVTENKSWALCNSIRSHGADAHVMLLVDIVRGRKPAHAAEREIVNSCAPALNTH